MRPPNFAILVLALVSLALGSTLFAQDATPAGPSVELSMIVTDSAKKSIDNIQKEDVHVIEDKVEQKVLSLERDRRPVDYVLAIDSSSSLRRLMPATLISIVWWREERLSQGGSEAGLSQR
jgi:hypothetical protein